MKTLGKISVAIFAAFGAMSVAQAATTTATFTVQANVAATCTASAPTLDFTTYDPAADKDATTIITVNCTNGTAVTSIAIPTGLSMAGSGTAAGSSLNFGLFNETGRTTAFAGAAKTSTGTAMTWTVYGRIPANQWTAKVGNYSTTVTATVSY